MSTVLPARHYASAGTSCGQVSVSHYHNSPCPVTCSLLFFFLLRNNLYVSEQMNFFLCHWETTSAADFVCIETFKHERYASVALCQWCCKLGAEWRQVTKLVIILLIGWNNNAQKNKKIIHFICGVTWWSEFSECIFVRKTMSAKYWHMHFASAARYLSEMS